MAFLPIEQEFERRLDQCWYSVLAADGLQLGLGHGWLTISRDVRASAVVLALAEFEGLLKESIEEMHGQVELSGVAVGDLRLGLRMLHADPLFGRAHNAGLDSMWESRALIGGSHDAAEMPVLPRRDPQGFIQPIGNATPKPTTIVRIWKVYGLAGLPLPQLAWQQALGDLSALRNDVAHRSDRLTLVMAGATRTPQALAEKIADVRDLGLHIIHSIEAYVANKGYVAV